MPQANRGVYFLSNDRIIDLAITFLNSFCAHNPHAPLCLIPYDANFQKVAELQSTYKFSIYSNAERLAECDRISERICGHTYGAFRKLAMWDGFFEEFLYIDADTVVLGNVDFMFNHLSTHDFVTGHSNIPGIVQFVWKPTIQSTGKLSDDQIAYAANTGLIVSRRSALPWDEIRAKVHAGVDLAPHMELHCMEQPFLNYLIVTSGRRYSSVLRITGEAVDVWAGTKGGVVEEGTVSFDGRTPVFIQWSGEWQARGFDKKIFKCLRFLGIRDKNAQPVMRFFPPYKNLWSHYRKMIDLPAHR